MADAQPTLGAKIRKARKDTGYNPERFAVALNISSATLQRWETDKSAPGLSKLAAIARFTRLPLQHFLDSVEAAA